MNENAESSEQKRKSGVKPLPLFFFSMLIGLVALGVVSGDRTNIDVLPLRESQIQEDLIDSSTSLRVNPEPVEWIEATLTVEEKTYLVSLPKGSSAYDFMAKAQQTSDLQFRGKEFPGLGFFIQEINGLEQSPRLGKYWIYYINGKKAEVGISAYMVNNHDVILWEYEHEE